ncbi:IclR family transcriptional regulator domain-containing protein, partial [Escherichia coli]
GEDYADVRCVAAPVFNANNELTAAISVVGTRLQINKRNRRSTGKYPHGNPFLRWRNQFK